MLFLRAPSHSSAETFIVTVIYNLCTYKISFHSSDILSIIFQNVGYSKHFTWDALYNVSIDLFSWLCFT